jgi:hypothetical protein
MDATNKRENTFSITRKQKQELEKHFKTYIFHWNANRPTHPYCRRFVIPTSIVVAHPMLLLLFVVVRSTNDCIAKACTCWTAYWINRLTLLPLSGAPHKGENSIQSTP